MPAAIWGGGGLADLLYVVDHRFGPLLELIARLQLVWHHVLALNDACPLSIPPMASASTALTSASLKVLNSLLRVSELLPDLRQLLSQEHDLLGQLLVGRRCAGHCWGREKARDDRGTIYR